MKKANGVITQSWNIGKIVQLENGLGRWIRNLVMGVTPNSIGTRQSAKIFDVKH